MKNKSKALKIDLQSLIGRDLFQTEAVYSASTEDEEVFHQKDLIELEVYGISLSPDPNHPFLLLKDKTEKYVLSVMINPLEAGVTLTQSNKSIKPVSPHRFASELLKSLSIEIAQCVFVQIKGTHQYVRIYFKGHPKLSSLKLRADEVMSLVLHLDIPIYSPKSFIEKSKILCTHIEHLSLLTGADNKLNSTGQTYVI